MNKYIIRPQGWDGIRGRTKKVADNIGCSHFPQPFDNQASPLSASGRLAGEVPASQKLATLHNDEYELGMQSVA